MENITNEYMQEMRAKTKNYCLIILKEGPNYTMPESKSIIWEHGRRNFALRAAGLLSIVCPVTDNSEVCGIGIFNTDENEVKNIMNDDPGVKEGIFIYEIHTCRSFPGDSLP